MSVSRLLLAACLACTIHPALAGKLPQPQHVVLVIEENRAFKTISGAADAAYINNLAERGALFTHSYAVAHPSEPNYLALFSGDTQGITDDSCPHSHDKPNLAQALTDRKLSFAIFSEDLPQAGFTGCGTQDGLYRRKHNPVPDFPKVPAEANKPFSDFPQDYSKLPTVAFVVPNMVNDMHDGTVAQADSWLKDKLDGYLKWAMQHHSLLIVTWDEDDGNENNRIMTVVLGQDVKPGQYGEPINHYSMLRTLTEMYGAKPVGRAVEAQPITDIWK